MLDFDGQVVIVTGSGSPKGIGRTIARTFARQKAAVVIADMNEAGVKDTVAAIKEEGGEAFGVVVNITDEVSVQNMVDQVMEQYGRIDVLVNNAGISQKVTVADMTLADMKRIFEVHESTEIWKNRQSVFCIWKTWWRNLWRSTLFRI